LVVSIASSARSPCSRAHSIARARASAGFERHQHGLRLVGLALLRQPDREQARRLKALPAQSEGVGQCQRFASAGHAGDVIARH
jgi:hypothetical protein